MYFLNLIHRSKDVGEGVAVEFTSVSSESWHFQRYNPGFRVARITREIELPSSFIARVWNLHDRLGRLNLLGLSAIKALHLTSQSESTSFELQKAKLCRKVLHTFLTLKTRYCYKFSHCSLGPYSFHFIATAPSPSLSSPFLSKGALGYFAMECRGGRESRGGQRLALLEFFARKGSSPKFICRTILPPGSYSGWISHRNLSNSWVDDIIWALLLLCFCLFSIWHPEPKPCTPLSTQEFNRSDLRRGKDF